MTYNECLRELDRLGKGIDLVREYYSNGLKLSGNCRDLYDLYHSARLALEAFGLGKHEISSLLLSERMPHWDDEPYDDECAESWDDEIVLFFDDDSSMGLCRLTREAWESQQRYLENQLLAREEDIKHDMWLESLNG